MIDDSRGKSAYAVFAARVRIAAVANCSTTYSTVPLPNTALPSCDITVSLLARVRAEVVGQDLHAHEQRAEDDRPSTSAWSAAFFDSGRRNAGTPLEIASTPVSATAPDEKPFSRMKMPSVPPNEVVRLPP